MWAAAKGMQGTVPHKLRAQRIGLFAQQVYRLDRMLRDAEPCCIASRRLAGHDDNRAQTRKHGVRHRVPHIGVRERALDLLCTATDTLQCDTRMLREKQVLGTEGAEPDAQEGIDVVCHNAAVRLGQHAKDHDRSAPLSTRDGPGCRVHVPERINDGTVHEALAMHDAEQLLETCELGQGRAKRALNHVPRNTRRILGGRRTCLWLKVQRTVHFNETTAHAL